MRTIYGPPCCRKKSAPEPQAAQPSAATDSFFTVRHQALEKLKAWARRLKDDVVAVWFCARHPDTPWLAKAVAAAVVAYAFSPIDLIPDFIPVIGYLDDLILVPLGIWLVLRLVPPAIVSECRVQAAAWLADRRPKPRMYAAAAVIIGLWLLALWLVWRWMAPAAP
jgi:uncharacterized membrane protein YkvA (DUF1232 family)